MRIPFFPPVLRPLCWAAGLAALRAAPTLAGDPDAIAAIQLEGPVATLSASVAQPGQVAEVEYRIDGIPVARVPAPFTATLDTGRLLANGPHRLEAVALDRSGARSPAPAIPFSLANPYRQLLRDPGLEAPAASGAWTGDVARAARQDPGSAATAHGGRGCLAFPGASGPLQVAQRVALPRNAGTATLRFWVRILGAPAAPGRPSGKVPHLRVLLRSVPEPGNPAEVLATLADLTPRDAWDDWVPYSADLSRLLDRQVEVAFQLDPGPGGTEFRVDDVTLVCGRPTVETAVAPLRLTVAAGASVPLRARVAGGTDPRLEWRVREPDGGSLAPSDPPEAHARIYRAPEAPGWYHVLATPAADPFGAGTVSIQVVAPGPTAGTGAAPAP